MKADSRLWHFFAIRVLIVMKSPRRAFILLHEGAVVADSHGKSTKIQTPVLVLEVAGWGHARKQLSHYSALSWWHGAAPGSYNSCQISLNYSEFRV